jgi:hypothetical protein
MSYILIIQFNNPDNCNGYTIQEKQESITCIDIQDVN